MPYADYYRYQITLVVLGNPVSQETGTTDDLFPLLQSLMMSVLRSRLDQAMIGLSTQAYYFEACPPFGPNLRRQTSDNIEGVTTKEKENIDGLKLFPNPAQEEIRITSTQPLQQVQIFDAAGQKVYGYDPIGLMKFLVVTVVNWPVGLYVVKATTQTGVVSKQFLVEK
ncbi:MAG: T9SS type A sorting domain-containing protein [Lewinellaceae bacterium]|nr:T9SS type A sorting domain-containing protein [Lewinellaceae bacterium]